MAYTFEPNVLYAKSHEWVRLEEDGTAVCGVSDVAQHLLSDVVFVDLPEVGAQFDQGDVCCSVESVKAAEDVYMPMSGTITEVNPKLADSPELVNSDPYGDAWFFKFTPSNTEKDRSALMKADVYEAFVAKEE